jgi:hypothetical protein
MPISSSPSLFLLARPFKYHCLCSRTKKVTGQTRIVRWRKTFCSVSHSRCGTHTEWLQSYYADWLNDQELTMEVILSNEERRDSAGSRRRGWMWRLWRAKLELISSFRVSVMFKILVSPLSLADLKETWTDWTQSIYHCHKHNPLVW